MQTAFSFKKSTAILFALLILAALSTGCERANENAEDSVLDIDFDNGSRDEFRDNDLGTRDGDDDNDGIRNEIDVDFEGTLDADGNPDSESNY